ncbi:hypothetical protein C7445_10131 [Alicyclobacillus sacchari]|uniref:Photosynthesis system II assembly factor YCF48-like protein n=1 Tax=Alicyclobacillus sacchari TaxID=392010 RepID=A0A4R8LTJ4_9BACL|nr:hypothetical protein [Alicyclobacillus sacchari]TDY51040.1 hypothetical protein C7445_10131 [Alicyclobacillus sacchari]
MYRSRLLSLAAAGAVALMAVGCGANTGAIVSKSQTSLRPSHDTAAVLQKPDSPGIPAPVSLAALQHNNVWYNIDLPDGDTGYRWGYMHGVFQMERTEDRGVSWRGVNLPVRFRLGGDSAYRGVENPQLAVVDLDTLYLYGVSGRSFVRAGTSDGGAHWSTYRTDLGADGFRVASVSQPAKSQAWVLLAGTGAANSGVTRLYHVTNGGATAAEVKVGPLPSGSGLPMNAQAVVAFTNLRSGWLLATDPRGELSLYRTEDGGGHWSVRTLNPPKQILGARAIRVFQPQLLEHEGTFAAMFATGSGKSSKPHVVIFRSRDGGKTVAGELTDQLDGAQANYEGQPAVFTTPDYGYAVHGGRLLRTTDSGDSWLAVHSPSLELWLQRYPCVLAMDFVSYTQGYMLLADRAQKHTVLLQTAGLRDRWQPVP